MLATHSDAVIVGGLLFGADDLVAEWIERFCGCSPVSEFASIGVLNARGEIIAGALFHSFQDGCDVVVTAACERPTMRLRSALRAGMSYCFDQLMVPRVTAEIDVTNARMINLATGIGFQLEGVKRKASRSGGNVGVFGLLKGELRI